MLYSYPQRKRKRKNFSYIELKVNDFVAVMHVETSHANLWQLRQSKALKWPISNTNVLDIFLPNVWHDFYYEWPCQKFQVSLYYWHGLFWSEECQRPRGGAPCQVDNPYIISQSFPGFTDPLPVPPSFWWSMETIFSCLLHLNIQGLLEPHCLFLRCPTHAGEMVAVTGSSSILGSWQKDKVILSGLSVAQEIFFLTPHQSVSGDPNGTTLAKWKPLAS